MQNFPCCYSDKLYICRGREKGPAYVDDTGPSESQEPLAK